MTAGPISPDAIYVGGNLWRSPTQRCGWIVYVFNSLFILASDPREPGGLAWSDPDGSGKVFYTLEELKQRLQGWTHLGALHAVLEGAPTVAVDDDPSRCAICGWTLAASVSAGCVRGNCARRPRPQRFYAPLRAGLEYGRLVRMDGRGHRFMDRAAQDALPEPGRSA